jgi:hypothetical protein
MKTIFDIAASAYAAHAKELARRIGVSSRPWTDIGSCEQKCWEQAAKQVLAEAAAMGMDMQKVAPEIDLQSVSPVSWARDDTATFNALLLVGGHDVPFSAIDSWTDMQCVQAEQWAMATHLHASDHDEVEVPEMPAHVRAFPPLPKWIGGA